MHVRCPHCQNAIEIVSNQDISEVLCPSCGSAFDLLPETKSFFLDKRSIGHFELLDQLGTGGYGTVWKARDTKLDRLVAIKVPRFDHADSEHAELFLREARAAAQLRHPYIVAVHEVGRSDGTLYLVSDFIQGITLADRLTIGPFAPRDAAALVAQTAEALHHAHEAGVIHRDLKPQNIMLDGQTRPLLMDFGLAKREAGEITITMDGKVLGTPAYMSPEQARGEGHRVDRRTDVYSLGVILFELVTGERPFRGNQRMLLHQVIHDEAPSPRKLNGRVPRDLETICLKCLEKDPRQRYATAADMAAELLRYLADEPIRARPVGPLGRAWRWTRRNIALAALSAAVIGILAVAAGVSTFFAMQASKAAQSAFPYYYAVQMNLAQRDWDASDLANMRDRLAKTTPQYTGNNDLRRFEWHHWDRVLAGGLFTLSHQGAVTSVALSHDGTRIASGGNDRTLRLWDANSGEEMLRFPGHADAGHANGLTSVAFNHDGTRLVSASWDGKLKLWDAATGNNLLTLRGHPGGARSVAYNHDGTRIVSGGDDNSAKVWNAATGDEVITLRGHSGGVTSVTFNTDGTKVVTGSYDKLVKIWDWAKGQELLSLNGHTATILSIAISHDGKRVASASLDTTLKFFDAVSGRDMLTLKGGANSTTSVAFSPDDRRIVSGTNDGTIKVLDAATGQTVVTLTGHRGAISSVAFSADGTRIASGSNDGTLKLWNATTDQKTITFAGKTAGTHHVSFDPTGARILSGGNDGAVTVWDAVTGKKSRTLAFPFASSEKKIEAASSQKSKTLASPVTAIVAIDQDCKSVAIGANDGLLTLWDAATGRKTFTLRGHTAAITSIALNATCTRIVSGSRDGTLKVWDAIKGVELYALGPASGGITSIAFNHDGTRIISGSDDCALRSWDVATGQKLFMFKGHTGAVTCAAFIADGPNIVSGSMDNTLKIWSGAGQEILTLKGHASSVKGLAIHPDGTRIVSGSSDRTLKVWDTATGQEVLTLRGHTDAISCIAFNSAGTRIISGGNDGTLKIWDGSPRRVAADLQLKHGQ